jgi:hypothetical protein
MAEGAPAQPYEVVAPQAPLRQAPCPDAPLDTEALRGERVMVSEIDGEGWAHGRLETDGYVGFLPASALAPAGPAPTHKVAALRTLVFPGPSIKLPPLEALPLGARIAVARTRDVRGDCCGRLSAGGSSRADRYLRKRLRRCGGALPQRALSLGRQDQPGARLLGAGAGFAGRLRGGLPARCGDAGAGARAREQSCWVP